jgi:cytochrome c-type biogenesis protein CcmH/NrfF
MRVNATALGTSLLTLAAILVSVADLPAQDQREVNRAAEEIYNSVMSPFCPGRLLSNCPSYQAADLRDRIRERLAAGETKEDVMDGLYAIWGEEVLGARRNAIAWLVPVAVIVLAGLLLVAWLRGTSRRYAERAAVPAPIDAESHRRLEAELSSL